MFSLQVNFSNLSTDQVANIINFFGAAGTVAAFIFAFYLERKNNKKINDLANIAGKLTEANEIQSKQTIVLQEQYRLQLAAQRMTVRPDIVNANGSYAGAKGTYSIVNKGYQCKITKIEYGQRDVQFIEKSLPLEWRTNMTLVFEFATREHLPTSEAIWYLKLTLSDLHGFPYYVRVKAIGNTIIDFKFSEDSYTLIEGPDYEDYIL